MFSVWKSIILHNTTLYSSLAQHPIPSLGFSLEYQIYCSSKILIKKRLGTWMVRTLFSSFKRNYRFKPGLVMMDGLCLLLLQTIIPNVIMWLIHLSWFFLNFFKVRIKPIHVAIFVKKKTNKKIFFAWLSQKKYMFF